MEKKEQGDQELGQEHEKVNEFENELEELKEWQDNRYNPGYYIGTGRVPRPLFKLTKYPVLIIILGMFMLVPGLAMLIYSVWDLNSIIPIIFSVIIPIIVIIGGVIRLRDRSNK